MMEASPFGILDSRGKMAAGDVLGGEESWVDVTYWRTDTSNRLAKQSKRR